MAHGFSVVAGAVGGIPEMIDDGRRGLLVPPDDVEALVAALRALLTDPERRALGAAARERVLAEFDLDVVWRRIDELYTSLSAARAGRDEPVPTAGAPPARSGVLFVVPDLGFGGAERHVVTLAPALPCDRVVASVVCIGEPGGLFPGWPPRGSRPALGRRRNPVAALLALVRVMRAQRPDVVVTRGYNAEALGRVAAVLTRVPRTVVWVHNCGDVVPRGRVRELVDRVLDPSPTLTTPSRTGSGLICPASSATPTSASRSSTTASTPTVPRRHRHARPGGRRRARGRPAYPGRRHRRGAAAGEGPREAAAGDPPGGRRGPGGAPARGR